MNPSWRRYLRFWGARVEEDVDDELAFHVEMRAREYIDRGMTEDEAYTAAMRRLGDGPVPQRALRHHSDRSVSYLTTGVLLLAVSLLACLLPMRRAMRVDPVIAMRAD